MSALIRRALMPSLLVLGLAVAASPALAQTGQVKGKVVDVKNQPVEKAQVTIEAIDGMGRKFNVTTNKKGEYIQIGLPPGQYTHHRDEGRPDRHAASSAIGLDPVGSELHAAGRDRGRHVAGRAEEGRGEERGDPRQRSKRASSSAMRTSTTRRSRSSTRCIAAIPKCVECVTNIASLQMQKKDYDAAEATYKKAIELNPSSAEAYNGLANLYNAQKKFDQAAEASAQAAKLGAAAPGGASASSVFNQGVIAWNASRIPDAKKAFEEAVRLDPKLAEAHYWLGMANLNEGKMPEAATSFEAYLKLDAAGKYAEQAKGILAQIKK